MECYCDDEPPELYCATRPIANRRHECEECNQTIQPGERYERVFGIWEGGNKVFKTCLYCLAIRDLCEQRLNCLCWSHGNTMEDIRSHLEERIQYPPGLSMAIGRIIVEQRHAD